MNLKQIIVTNFRNYEKETLDFSDRINCFTGLNGMGKTNLLDGIYYMCMTKSNFNQSDKHIVRHGITFFRLEGHFVREEKKEVIVVKSELGKKKKLERNDVPYKKLAEHIGLLPVVFIKPEDTVMATGGSEERRRFLDNTLSQLDSQYLSHLVDYTKILKQRNAALKNFAKRGNYDASLIQSYNEQMEGPSNYIFAAREKFIKEFTPLFKEYYQTISANQEPVDCQYISQLSNNTIAELMEMNLRKDQILARTNAGIHKDDIQFLIHELELKKYASQGQLKSYILAMKLAQYDFIAKQGTVKPILLLDDIFDKLDANRVRQLIELVGNGNFGQIFISDTGIDRLTNILTELKMDFRNFKVNDGKVAIVE